MDRPPRIDVEVVPPPSSGGTAALVRDRFHPAAAAMLVLVDNFWTLPEFAVLTWGVTMPACFLSVFALTFWIQRRWGADSRRAAGAKAFFLAVVAAVPFSVTGTPLGLALLGWAGIRRLRR